MDRAHPLDRRIGQCLNKSSSRESSHINRTGGARTDQHQIGIEQPVHRDAGVEQTIAKPQLHEHQDPGKADPSQSHQKANGLTGQQQPGQRNSTSLPEGLHGSNRAMTFNPAKRITRRTSAASRATSTSTTRASASPVGSVDSTSRCCTRGLIWMTRPLS